MKKIILLLIGILALGFIWYLVLYKPTRIKNIKFRKEIDDIMLQIRSITVSPVELASLEREYETLEKEVQEEEARIYPKSRLGFVTEQISRRGRVYNLRFISITPSFDTLFPLQGLKKGDSPLIKLPVEFEIQGRYRDFGRFLESLRHLPFAFSIEEVKLVSDPKLYPDLNITMTGFIYLRE